MSGGSFDYLYLKEAGDFVNYGVDERLVREMADRLAELGYHDAAVETNDWMLEVKAVRARLEARLNRLQPIWKAIEWHTSGDSGPEAVESAMATYRGEKVAV